MTLAITVNAILGAIVFAAVFGLLVQTIRTSRTGKLTIPARTARRRSRALRPAAQRRIPV
jgi:ABC-type amino acid transport system permease subunit